MTKRTAGPGCRWRAAGVAGLGLALLTGCANFFQNPNNTGTTGPTTGTGTTTGDYVYVLNDTTNTLSQFQVGPSELTPISGSPISLGGTGFESAAVTRGNQFVYVGGAGVLQCYSIGSTGALTAQSAAELTQANTQFVSLTTSPVGLWLLALDGNTQTIFVYGINTTTGVLTQTQALPYTVTSGGTVTPHQISISPNGGLVAVALGAAGDLVFTFNTSTGLLTQTAGINPASQYNDNALLFDATSGYLFVARQGPLAGSSGITSYSVTTTGVATAAQSLIASGDDPYWLVEDKSNTYIYAANRGSTSNSISGYSVSGGTLTALATSPYASGTQPTALAVDSSGKYLVAAAIGGSNDVTMYGFDALTLGKLDPVATAISGTDPAGSAVVLATY